MRESLSARLDGEAVPLSEHVVTAHLESCPACQAFGVQIAALARVRIRTLEEAPSLVPGILATLGETVAVAPRHDRAHERFRPHSRRVLRWVAALPACLALSGLASGAFAHPLIHPTHASTPCTAAFSHRAPRRG